METPVIMRAFQLALINNLRVHTGNPAAGPLDGVLVGLYASAVTLSPDLVMADLTPATFDGYAESAAITWDAGYIDAVGVARTVSNLLQFLMTGNTTPNTVYGWYLQGPTVGGVPGDLLAAAEFDTPIPMHQLGDAIQVIPNFSMPQPV